jgi:hypothetical protein
MNSSLSERSKQKSIAVEPVDIYDARETCSYYAWDLALVRQCRWDIGCEDLALKGIGIMLLICGDLAVPLPSNWSSDYPHGPQGPAVGLAPPHGSFRPNIVISAEPMNDAYESIDAFAKRTFNALQRELDNFTVFDERLINIRIPMFRRNYSMMPRSPVQLKIRQIQYYIKHAEQFYSLTFADSDDRQKQIAALAAVMTGGIRLLYRNAANSLGPTAAMDHD